MLINYEDFKIRIGDVDNVHVSEWLVTPFDVKLNNKHESDVEDELIVMRVDLKAIALFKCKKPRRIL